jgi:hypothetical protein
MKKYVIVSRHQAAIDFIRANDARFLAAPVITGNATPDDVRGKHVAGNLPLSLASICDEVVAVEFTGAPPRGAEYSAADMVAAGARLESYVVKRSLAFDHCVTHGRGDAY